MKKAVAILALLAVVGSLTGCMGYHKITYDKENIYNCPKRAKAGDLVQFETVIVCDADLYAFVNDVKLQPVREGYYEFTMPDNDVELRVVIISNGLA